MVRKPSPPSSISSTSSQDSVIYPPSALSAGWEADDEDTMSVSTEEDTSTRPLSVAIPRSSAAHGPYCPRRPGLKEILANTSEPPWTLTAFMAYLSNNHCLETLEFTMDAGRYKKHYAKMTAKAGDNAEPSIKDRDFVRGLWQQLVEAYIKPNGPREVNIPGDIREPIMKLSAAEQPPPPEALDQAVTKVYELMEESVLGPFLNSVYPQTAHPTISSAPSRISNEDISRSTARSHRNTSPKATRSPNRLSRHSPTPQSAVEPHAHSYSSPSSVNRRTESPTLPNRTRFSTKLSQSTSSPATSHSTMSRIDQVTSGSDTGSGSGAALTDDGSTDSPATDSPATPPMTPPASDYHQSPKRDSGMWKKLGRLSGMKVPKKQNDGKVREDQ